MGPTRHEMRDVELVELDDANPAPGSGPAGGGPADDDTPWAAAGPDRRPASSRRRGPRVPPLLAGAVGAVLLVGVGAGTLVSDHRERDRLAALADVPGVLRPLAGPVGE
jgi:hypothetical protein